LTAGGAFRVRLQGNKRTDPIVVDSIGDETLTYRLTWQSKGERVFGKPHTRPVGEVEVIATLDLGDRFVWSKGDVEVQPEEEPKRPRPRSRRKATAAA
jgi:hypothetical protein